MESKSVFDQPYVPPAEHFDPSPPKQDRTSRARERLSPQQQKEQESLRVVAEMVPQMPALNQLIQTIKQRNFTSREISNVQADKEMGPIM